MGKIITKNIHKELEVVKDLLPRIVHANALMIFGNRGSIDVHSFIPVYPENDLDPVKITFNGKITKLSARDFVVFELHGKSEVYLVAECLVDNPIVEEFVNFILNELEPLEQSNAEKNFNSGNLLPKIEDPTDQRIWEWVKEDPSLSDTKIAQRLDITRQAANARRRSLEKMGYPVRKRGKKKSKSVKTKSKSVKTK